jgi:hypothetical protein
MRNIILASFFILLLSASNIHAQKIYSSNQIKLIFANAPGISRGNENIASPLRFTAFFNYSTFLNYNLTKHLGLSAGLEIKNIGVVLKDSAFSSKHRAYALGVPLYVRIGNLDKKWYFLAGAQYDFHFAYKEKVFVDDAKVKRYPYNSVRTFMPSVFIGYKSKSGASLSVHYMLQNFFSDDYRFKDPRNSNALQPYANSQLLCFTIGFMGDVSRKKSKPAPKPEERKQEVFSKY